MFEAKGTLKPKGTRDQLIQMFVRLTEDAAPRFAKYSPCKTRPKRHVPPQYPGRKHLHSHCIATEIMKNDQIDKNEVCIRIRVMFSTPMPPHANLHHFHHVSFISIYPSLKLTGIAP